MCIFCFTSDIFTEKFKIMTYIFVNIVTNVAEIFVKKVNNVVLKETVDKVLLNTKKICEM